jgi:hypothetical protein
MYVGRFRRPFPCWPCALPGGRDDRLPLPRAVIDKADKTLLPDDAVGLLGKDYIANAEAAGDGFFPIGLSRTWHGGIHLVPGANRAIRAISDGVIVAARCPRVDSELPAVSAEKKLAQASPSLPSRNFVLIRHQARIGGAVKVFYSLYMQLNGAPADAELHRARWLWQSRQNPATLQGYRNNLAQRLDSGDVVLLAYPVAAGDVIGFSGDGAVHLEVFAEEDITDGDYAGKSPGKKLIEDTDKDLFTDSKELFAKLNSQTDLVARIRLGLSHPAAAYSGVVLKEEIANLFNEGDEATRLVLRSLVTRHISEWSTLIDWSGIKNVAAWGYYDDAAVQGLKDIVGLYAWLSPEVASRCLLPVDHIVHHYHPIIFIDWLAQHESAEPVVQDVVPFLADAGEPFDPITGHAQPEWEINPDHKVNGHALELLVLFQDDGGKPSSQTAKSPDDPGKPLKETGPWPQIGACHESGGNRYVRVHDEPARWICAKSGNVAYARERA